MYDKVYVIPSYKCNLNCSHCDIHTREDNFKEKEFFDTLNKIESKEFVLFGGEPLLNKELFKKCVDTNKITSISTNLLLLDDEFIDIIKKYKLFIATSWNPSRFTENSYKLWIEKLKLLNSNKLKCSVLITLTQDLFDYNKTDLIEILKEIDKTGSVDEIRFEHLVDSNLEPDFHRRADEWLCGWYNNWNFKMKNAIENMIKNWCFNCSNVYTLQPSGDLVKGCPQYIKAEICTECYTCRLANICHPCSLQKTCSFPKRLFELINNNISRNGV